LSDLEPIIPLRPRIVTGDKNRNTQGRSNRNKKNLQHNNFSSPAPIQVAFNRHELNTILSVYGHHVAAGNWRDYAINFGRETAVFSIFKRTSECPLYRVEKNPKLAHKQGAYCVTDHSGRILKRGRDLAQVLKILALKPRLSVI